jgi:hypothetical protein
MRTVNLTLRCLLAGVLLANGCSSSTQLIQSSVETDKVYRVSLSDGRVFIGREISVEEGRLRARRAKFLEYWRDPGQQWQEVAVPLSAVAEIEELSSYSGSTMETVAEKHAQTRRTTLIVAGVVVVAAVIAGLAIHAELYGGGQGCWSN